MTRNEYTAEYRDVCQQLLDIFPKFVKLKQLDYKDNVFNCKTPEDFAALSVKYKHLDELLFDIKNVTITE